MRMAAPWHELFSTLALPNVATRRKKTVRPTKMPHLLAQSVRLSTFVQPGSDQGYCPKGALAASQMRSVRMVTSSVGRTESPLRMAAARRAVPRHHDGMHVQAGLAVVSDRNVAQHAQSFSAARRSSDRTVIYLASHIEPPTVVAHRRPPSASRGAAQRRSSRLRSVMAAKAS